MIALYNSFLILVESLFYRCLLPHDYKLASLDISHFCSHKLTSWIYILLHLITSETISWENYILHLFTPTYYMVLKFFANTAKSFLDKLIKLNNKLLRILLNKKMETPIISLYQSFNVLPLPLLHEMQMLVFVHKCYYKLDVPLIFRQYFVDNQNVHRHHTRNHRDLHIKIVNSNIGQRCSLFCGSRLWNALPKSLKTISYPIKFISRHSTKYTESHQQIDAWADTKYWPTGSEWDSLRAGLRKPVFAMLLYNIHWYYINELLTYIE